MSRSPTWAGWSPPATGAGQRVELHDDAGRCPGHRPGRLPRRPGGADQRPQARARARPSPSRSTGRATAARRSSRWTTRRRRPALDLPGIGRRTGRAGRTGPAGRRHSAQWTRTTAAGGCGPRSLARHASPIRRPRQLGEAPVISVLLVDDEALVRAGLRMILETADDLTVVGDAEDGRAAIEAVGRDRPDVVLMDIRMPRLDGLAATAAIRARPTAAGGRGADHVRHRRRRVPGAGGRRDRVPAQGHAAGRAAAGRPAGRGRRLDAVARR